MSGEHPVEPFALLPCASVGSAAANPHASIDVRMQGLCCASARGMLLRGCSDLCGIVMKK